MANSLWLGSQFHVDGLLFFPLLVSEVRGCLWWISPMRDVSIEKKSCSTKVKCAWLKMLAIFWIHPFKLYKDNNVGKRIILQFQMNFGSFWDTFDPMMMVSFTVNQSMIHVAKLQLQNSIYYIPVVIAFCCILGYDVALNTTC